MGACRAGVQARAVGAARAGGKGAALRPAGLRAPPTGSGGRASVRPGMPPPSARERPGRGQGGPAPARGRNGAAVSCSAAGYGARPGRNPPWRLQLLCGRPGVEPRHPGPHRNPPARAAMPGAWPSVGGRAALRLFPPARARTAEQARPRCGALHGCRAPAAAPDGRAGRPPGPAEPASARVRGIANPHSRPLAGPPAGPRSTRTPAAAEVRPPVAASAPRMRSAASDMCTPGPARLTCPGRAPGRLCAPAQRPGPGHPIGGWFRMLAEILHRPPADRQQGKRGRDPAYPRPARGRHPTQPRRTLITGGVQAPARRIPAPASRRWSPAAAREDRERPSRAAPSARI